MAHEKIKQRIQKMLQTAVLGSVLVGGVGCGGRNTPSDRDSDKNKIDTVENVLPKVSEPIETITYQTDTLAKPTSVLLYYLPSAHKIFRNFIENYDSYRLRLPYFAHEHHHEINDKLGYSKTAFSPEEYYKLRLHDEISANLTAILTARFEYLASEDKAGIIKKYENTYMGFYFKAIKNHEINPESNKNTDRQKEWKFLANGTQEMWMRMFYKTYMPRTARSVIHYVQRNGLPTEDTSARYNATCQAMYKLGGVDFWSYTKDDILSDQSILGLNEKNTLSILNEIRKSPLLSKIPQIQEAFTAYKPILEKMEKNERFSALQHFFISALLKKRLRAVPPQDLRISPQLVTSCYRQAVDQLKSDQAFQNIINNNAPLITDFSPVREQTADMHSTLKDLYHLNDIDLTSLISNFDGKNLPISQSLIKRWDEQNEQLMFAQTLFMTDMELKALQKDQRISGKKTPMERHLSQDLKIILPNFTEPVLTDCTPEQYEFILQEMRNFENIPNVLKGCNVEAQSDFIKQNPQYKNFIENYAKNGR